MPEVPEALRGRPADIGAHQPLAGVPEVQVALDAPGPVGVLRQDGQEELMFNRLREALEAALAAATPPPDLGEIAARMREAVIDQKAGVAAMRVALEKDEQALAGERGQLETAERRRKLAADISDAETVEVAERFIAKHRERVAVLEKKVAAQREELGLAERDLVEMQAQLVEAAKRRPGLEGERSAEQAWRSLGEAGMDRPELDVEQEALKARMDRAAREATAEAKLDELKKRMGRS
jgi:hypothetical protein